MGTHGDRVSVAKTWKLFIGGAFTRSESGHSLRQDDAGGALDRKSVV